MLLEIPSLQTVHASKTQQICGLVLGRPKENTQVRSELHTRKPLPAILKYVCLAVVADAV